MPGMRRRTAGPEVVSKAGRKVCRCSADAAQFGFGFGFDFGLASALSRETGRRETASDKVARRRNPASDPFEMQLNVLGNSVEPGTNKRSNKDMGAH